MLDKPPDDVVDRWRRLRIHDWINSGGLLLGLMCIARDIGLFRVTSVFVRSALGLP